LAERIYAKNAFWRAFRVLAFYFGGAVWALALVFYVVYDLSVLAVGYFFD
jgi:hypothetical protein